MALPKFTLYKYVRTERGWRYCRACFHTNGKIIPNTVFVNNKPERHAEGRYYMACSGQWIDAGRTLSLLSGNVPAVWRNWNTSASAASCLPNRRSRTSGAVGIQ